MRRFVVQLLVAVALVAALGGAAPAGAEDGRLRVGLVLTGGIDDPFEGMAYQGLRRAVETLGVRGRVLVAPPREGSLPSFAYLARRHFDLVMAVGALQMADLDLIAREYPRSRFVVLDASHEWLAHKPSNVRGTSFEVQEGAYLAGYLAGLTERMRPGPDVVSSVGCVKAPQVDRFIAGFHAGARSAAPGVRTLNAYAGSFLDPARCRAIAVHQIARGSGVVFQVAAVCGLGALAAAHDAGRFGIGVDVDQSALGPHVLTSVVKRLDVAAYDAIADLVHGRFRTGVDRVYDLRNGGVDLGKLSPRVPPRLVAALERMRSRLVAGRLPPIPTTLPS